MKDERDIEKDLQPSAEDYIHIGTKAGLTTLPGIGGIIAEYFSAIVPPAIQKRRDEWLREIYYRLKALETKIEGFKIENLATNENFISTLLHATQIAIRTRDKEKIESLRNAVINSSSTMSIDESEQMIFLNLVDRYSPWHLKTLHFLEDPRQYGKMNNINYPSWSMGGTSAVLEFAFPELKGRRDLYDKIVKDLYSDGLLNSDIFLHATMSENGMFAKRTTMLGDKFLEFISSRP